jgi:nitrile hydratase subunit beta
VNTVHDMGGGQNFGPVAAEPDEPWFHHEWERRVFGLTLAMGATGQWNLDQTRFARESLPPAKYLASSYYEIWLEGLTRLMLERGLVTAGELQSGSSATPPKPVNVLSAERVPAVLANRRATGREPTNAARFRVGDAVRTANLHPRSHTRLPRYCRDKPGTIVRVHGVHVFPDANARGVGEQPQWLYGVRFEARDLWGADTTAAAVVVDCFEPYLESR